jgi:hypothetical protein
MMARRQKTARQLAGEAKDAAIVDERERHPKRSLTSLFQKHHRDGEAFKKHVPTEKVGSRLDLAPPSRRRLDRGTIPMLADIDGVPTVVAVRPANDSQYYAIKGHDAAVYAADRRDDDSRLPRYARRVVHDLETGRRYRFYVDGDGIRAATDVGEFEMAELYYSGSGRRELDALMETAE